MTTYKDIGTIEKKDLKTYEEAHIEWRVPNFSTIETADTQTHYSSPVFFINDVSWFLRLFPRSAQNSEFMRLYIFASTSSKREYSLEYNLGLKKSDGSVEQKINGILEGNSIMSGHEQLIKRSEILQRKSELAPLNEVIFTCTMRREFIHSTQRTKPHKTTSVKMIRLERLSKNFKDIFGDKDTCDTTLKVKEKEYKAHRLILMARSAVFAATFKHDTLERQTGVITISDCDPDSFQLFLDYLYSGQLEELSYPSALNLYYTSDKYDVTELKESCLEYLMQCLTVENVCQLAIFADKQDEKELFSAVQGFFNQNIFKILSTSDWDDLLMKDPRLANKLLKELSKVKLRE